MGVLRVTLLVIGIVALAGALIALIAGAPVVVLIWLVLIGGALVIGVIFERGRYKPAEPKAPGSGWVATGESFIDPTSGEAVTVYYEPATGERRYVRR